MKPCSSKVKMSMSNMMNFEKQSKSTGTKSLKKSACDLIKIRETTGGVGTKN